MSGVLLGSALEEAAKRLPKALKPDAVIPALKKAGVKDEELELSGIGVRLPEYLQATAKDEKGRIPSQDIADYIEGWRTDRFSSVIKDEPKYSFVVPKTVRPRQQDYKERIYEFKSPNSVNYGSTHFNYSDYLMHTRMWDDKLDGVDTRVIGEIQSDLHQNNKAAVTGLDDATLNQLSSFIKNLKRTPGLQDMAATTLRSAFSGASTNLTKAEMNRKVDQLINAGLAGADNIEQLVKETYKAKDKDAPWKTSWMRKGLENEIKQALAEGKPQIAVPIKNTLDLMTKEDIDYLIPLANNFNEVIKNNLNKRGSISEALLAVVPNATQKQRDFLDMVGDLIKTNYDYAPQNTHLQDITSYLSDDYLASYNEVAADSGSGNLDTMARSGGVQKWYETAVSPTVQKLAKQLGLESKRVLKDGIEYEVIDFTSKANTKEFKNWFGGSKVVDKNNKPLVVYHGTQAPKFDKFEHQGESNLFGTKEQFYFTNDLKEAESYAVGNQDTVAKGRSGKGRVMKSYLKMDKPANLTADGWNVHDVPVQDYLENLDMDGLYDAIRNAGYDGIIYDGDLAPMPAFGTHYVVFDPKQIKNADVAVDADNAFKLYAGGGVLAYYMAMAQGYTPGEISKYMEEQGFSEDEIQDAKANWKKAKEAKKAGKSDEEINAMFGTNVTIKE